ncbi:MAG: methyltransferase domain-containing protein, partial [Steroidobacteraceae bacterium]
MFDVVDFNKACSEACGKSLPLAGVPVYYVRCNACGFCYAPEFQKWTPEDFRRHIYNERYLEVDPEYVDVRPRTNATLVGNTFKEQVAAIRHLDYGGGQGLLSRLLREAGWNSASYDPFVDTAVCAQTLGVFDLITAFEVFEHVVDPNALLKQLKALLSPGGMVV